MKDAIDLTETKLGPSGKKAVTTFCSSLKDVLSTNIKSITIYGSAARKDYRPGNSDINILVILERINVSILRSILKPISEARRNRIAPFIMTEWNLSSSANVFPAKFIGMQESYIVVFGSDVLRDLKICSEHLRLRCEQYIKSVLLRLRRHYIVANGQGLGAMMSRIIVGFLENLRIALSIDKKNLIPREKVIDTAADTFNFDAEIIKSIKSLKVKQKKSILPLRKEPEQLYDQFMSAVEKVAQGIHQMNVQE